MHSPFLPTPLELALLALYPLTLILGSLFSTLSPYVMPPKNLSTYSALHQSYQPASSAPSYFATKANVFNRYFVKIGWFWVTLALFLFTLLAARGRKAIDVGFAASHARRERVLAAQTVRLSDLDETNRRHERDERLRRVYQVALRWALLTTVWYGMTQGLAGAPIIERVFNHTGGACYATVAHPHSQTRGETGEMILDVKSHGECRRRGGRFAGGLDISGHVFLLVLGSGMLFAEVLPVILPWVRGLTSARLVRQAGRVGPVRRDDGDARTATLQSPAHGYGTRAARRAKLAAEETSEKPLTTRLKEYAMWLVSAILVLSWWMLLMTAAFFHTWVEKGSALCAAAAVLWAVYVLPRGVEGVGGIVGLPGA